VFERPADRYGWLGTGADRRDGGRSDSRASAHVDVDLDEQARRASRNHHRIAGRVRVERTTGAAAEGWRTSVVRRA